MCCEFNFIFLYFYIFIFLYSTQFANGHSHDFLYFLVIFVVCVFFTFRQQRLYLFHASQHGPCFVIFLDKLEKGLLGLVCFVEIEYRRIMCIAPIQKPLIIVQQDGFQYKIREYRRFFFVQFLSQLSRKGRGRIQVRISQPHKVQRFYHLE